MREPFDKQIYSISHPTWGFHVINLAEIWSYIRDTNLKPWSQVLNVEEWARACGVNKTRADVDDSHAKTVNTKYPVVVVRKTMNDGNEVDLLVDGLHRLRNAYLMGIPYLDAYHIVYSEILTWEKAINENIVRN